MTSNNICTTIGANENSVDFLASCFERIIRNGKLPSLFNLVIEEARSILDDGDYDSLSQKQYTMNNTIGQAKQALAVATKRSINCCSSPLEVRGRYERQRDRHSLLVRCNHCGAYLYLTEQEKPRYNRAVINPQKGVFWYARTSNCIGAASNYDR